MLSPDGQYDDTFIMRLIRDQMWKKYTKETPQHLVEWTKFERIQESQDYLSEIENELKLWPYTPNPDVDVFAEKDETGQPVYEIFRIYAKSIEDMIESLRVRGNMIYYDNEDQKIQTYVRQIIEIVVVVWFFIGTQNRLVALHSVLFLGSRRGGRWSAQCNLSIH
jgi:hypothetical protein